MEVISEKLIDRYALSHDASHYSLIPKQVARPENLQQLRDLLNIRNLSRQPITFRSAGTSLSGQSISSELIIDTRRGFKKIEILDNGARIRVEPGVTIREVNNRLKSFGYKFGPDPASEIACTIGGAIANNSSGMLCGTETNAYRTIESAKALLADGTLIDTADNEPLPKSLHDEIVALRNLVNSDSALKDEIERQFRLKNTMGYGINAFIDYFEPKEILLHLLIGSEGTLGFIAEATFRTVPIKAFAASTLLVFPTLKDSNQALGKLVESGAAAIELLDQTSLRVGQRNNRAIPTIKNLRIDREAALIVEYQEDSALKLTERIGNADELISRLPTRASIELTTDLKTRNDLWHLRKGLYASVSGARRKGTTAILEDIAVPVDLLADTCESLINLFDKYKYQDSVIFGHAKDGNIHFMLSEDFQDKESQERYAHFTEAMVDLVLENHGTLKAEHGTGRVMAPFVERQYGSELYSVMVRVKNAFDPNGILNPDVIITRDKSLHLKNFKAAVEVAEEVNSCVECGFCEPVCPSKNLTLTPRQRIIIERAPEEIAKKIRRDASYAVTDTCAVDGICSLSCPLGINTGLLIKKKRSQKQSLFWRMAAKRYGATLSIIRFGTNISKLLPPLNSVKFTSGKKRKSRLITNADIVYLPSCVGEFFGPTTVDPFLELCKAAGIKVLIPEGISNLCCGTPWSSKGEDSFIPTELNHKGLPIVADNLSCTEGFKKIYPDREVVDATSFALNKILPNLTFEKVDSLVLHPTCSSEKMDESRDLISLAKLISDEVIVPPNWGCCGFAGDRGLLLPELTDSATADEAEYVASVNTTYYVSANRTCEMAMSKATGRSYGHILSLLAAQIR